MAIEFKLYRDYWDIGEYIYTKSKVVLEPGITVLVGCNGSGKSTFLAQLKHFCTDQKIFLKSYNNVTDGGSRSAQKAEFHGDFKFLSTLLQSSEGEGIYLNIGYFSTDLGSTINRIRTNDLREYEKNYNKEKMVIVLDAVDSGMSVDIIVEIKNFIKDVVIPEIQSVGMEAYIIISTNTYEFANGENCLDVQHMKYITFADYEDYKKFIFKTAKFKNNRTKVKKKEAPKTQSRDSRDKWKSPRRK